MRFGRRDDTPLPRWRPRHPHACSLVKTSAFRILRASVLLLATCCALPSVWPREFAGHYVVASLPATSGATLSSAIYAGTADVAARQHGYSVTWHLRQSAKRLRGLGMTDAADLLGVSLVTGGAVNGLGIYHHSAEAHAWQGHWITSLDSGGTVGEIRFDDNGGGSLLGRHPLFCRRPGSGSFEGAVNITAQGANYLLTFEVGRSVLYRGVGILLDDGNRLVVGWSFGSPPALAVYQMNADGLFNGRRVNPRAEESTVREVFARDGEDALRLLPIAARTDPSQVPGDVDASLEPGSPEIKHWNYDDLMTRYGGDGWGDRWLDEQLTPEEHALLHGALKRRRTPRVAARLPHPTIGELIDAQRQRTAD